jgi:hypothetical protein
MPDFVYVGCRLPNGIHMDLGDTPGERRVTLQGMNSRTAPDGTPLMGFPGVTPVEKGFWDEWAAKHKDAPYMKSGVIYAAKSQADAEKEGQNRASDLTGFEGAEPPKKSDIEPLS